MQERLRQARAKKAVEFGVLINRIVEHDGKITRPMIRSLAKLKRTFTATSNDSVLGEMIQAHLLVLAEVEAYIKKHNAGDEVEAKVHYDEAIRLWNEGDVIANKISERME